MKHFNWSDYLLSEISFCDFWKRKISQNMTKFRRKLIKMFHNIPKPIKIEKQLQMFSKKIRRFRICLSRISLWIVKIGQKNSNGKFSCFHLNRSIEYYFTKNPRIKSSNFCPVLVKCVYVMKKKYLSIQIRCLCYIIHDYRFQIRILGQYSPQGP